MQNYPVPISIIVAGALIAGALFLVNRSQTMTPGENTTDTTAQVRPLSENDHILGNPNAEIVIVEYSDIDCPFCKQFHETMKRLMDEYGTDGKIAWVYRHFPLTQLHPNARTHAIASECVAQVGGNAKFWEFLDAVFAANPGSAQADPSSYNTLVESIGVSVSEFESCMQGDTTAIAARVDGDYENALAAGGQGTPHNILIIKGLDEPIAVPGAQPYENMRGIIEQILNQNGTSN
jgi:protein-disulfide isomerase